MNSPRSMRALGALLVLATAPLALAAMSAHATLRTRERAREQRAIENVVRFLPASDLALGGGGRSVRTPSLEEPAAALHDGPTLPDADPAGGMLAPPRAVWALEERAR